jgi:hypothetical protein
MLTTRPRSVDIFTSNQHCSRSVGATSSVKSTEEVFSTSGPICHTAKVMVPQVTPRDIESTRCLNSMSSVWAEATRRTVAQSGERSASILREVSQGLGTGTSPPEEQPFVATFTKWQCHLCKAGPIIYDRQQTCLTCYHRVCDTCKKDADIPAPLGPSATADTVSYSRQKFWFCSNTCEYPGPWRDSLTRCITCGHDRCCQCLAEWHQIRDDKRPLGGRGSHGRPDKLAIQAENRKFTPNKVDEWLNKARLDGPFVSGKQPQDRNKSLLGSWMASWAWEQ